MEEFVIVTGVQAGPEVQEALETVSVYVVAPAVPAFVAS